MEEKSKTTDIVCGMSVQMDESHMSMYGDRPYYFCSQNCQDAFVNDPLKYVDKSKSATSLEGTPMKGENAETMRN